MAAPDLNTLTVAGTLKTKFGVFTLHVDADRLAAYLSCEYMDKRLDLETLRGIIAQMNVSFGLQDDALASIIALAAEDKPAILISIARGIPVQEGRDACLNFEKKPVGSLSDAAREGGKVDYREFRAFDNVKAGDLIATYVPSQDGEGGTDISGRIIPAKKPRELTVSVGENVNYDSGKGQYFATSYGFVRFDRGKLSVETIYHVKGSLDLSHGNLRFVGRVEIDRDVPDEFEVSADEGISIGGTAEACRLTSQKEIRIDGGVTGKGKGKIEAKGDLVCRFLNEVEVVCGGDITVTKEIVNARVYALGRVIVKEGTIVGSEVVALQGILTRDAGSELGVKTLLVAGLDYHVRERLLGLNKELVRLQERQQELLNRAGPALQRVLRAAIVDNRVRSELSEVMGTIRSMQRQIVRLDAESGEIMRTFETSAINCISVTRTVYPGVTAVSGKFERDNGHAITGPVSFVPDPERHTLAMQNGALVERLWADAASQSGTPGKR